MNHVVLVPPPHWLQPLEVQDSGLVVLLLSGLGLDPELGLSVVTLSGKHVSVTEAWQWRGVGGAENVRGNVSAPARAWVHRLSA